MEKKQKISIKKIKIFKNNLPKKRKVIEPKIIKKRIIDNRNEEEKSMSALEKQKLNDLSHLFRNSQNSDIDVKWTLSLRNSEYDPFLKSYERKMLKFNRMKPPSFFYRDLDNFIKKKKERIDSCDNIVLPNLIKYTGLFKKRISDTHGAILNNRRLLDFELNLRKINNNNNKNFNKNNNRTVRYDDSPKWDNSILIKKKDDLKLNNYSMDIDKSSRVEGIKEKFIRRPYKVIFKKEKLDGKSYFFRKTYIKDKDKAYNEFLDVYSLGPYNDNYGEKNYLNIISGIEPKERNQQNLNYNFNLRKYK